MRLGLAGGVGSLGTVLWAARLMGAHELVVGGYRRQGPLDTAGVLLPPLTTACVRVYAVPDRQAGPGARPVHACLLVHPVHSWLEQETG